MATIEPLNGRINVVVEGTQVVLVINGQRASTIPWRAAERLATAIKQIANKAALNEEEIAKQVITDNAILLRSGFGLFGLSNDPAIKKETEKEAAHNPDLRKYIDKDFIHKGAGDIQSHGALGTPNIIKHRPKKGVIDEILRKG